MRRLVVSVAKTIGVLVAAVSFAAVGSVAAFLVTYFVIDGSEPENPGTDLGAGIAFLLLLPVGVVVGGGIGVHFGMRLLFNNPVPPATSAEVR